MHDVPILHHILLAFHPELSCFLDFLLGLVQKEVLTVVHLRLDEAFLKVRVDDSGSLGCLVPCAERPRPVLIGTCGKEGAHPKRMIGTADELVQARLLQSYRLQELTLLLLGLQHSDFRLNLAADDHHFRSFSLGDGPHCLYILILFYNAVLIDVADIDDRLEGDEMQVRDHG